MCYCVCTEKEGELMDIIKNDKKFFSRSDIDLNQVSIRGNSEFRVIGIADKPTVIIENIKTGERETHVISSLNFSKFKFKKTD